MNEKKMGLIGSPYRDTFKNMHKKLEPWFYASDADLCLISFRPPGVVAYLDVKRTGDPITDAETVLYNSWVRQAPVYIVEMSNPLTGPFKIRRYLGARTHKGNRIDWHDEVCEEVQIRFCKNWKEFEDWERGIRNFYRKSGGWEHVKLLASLEWVRRER